MEPPVVTLAMLQAELVYLDERRVTIDKLLSGESPPPGPGAAPDELQLAVEWARDITNEFDVHKYVPPSPLLAVGQLWGRGHFVPVEDSRSMRFSQTGQVRWVEGLVAEVVELGTGWADVQTREQGIAAGVPLAPLARVRYVKSGATRWRLTGEFLRGGPWRYLGVSTEAVALPPSSPSTPTHSNVESTLRTPSGKVRCDGREGKVPHRRCLQADGHDGNHRYAPLDFVERRSHSRSGQVRCDICAPARCIEAT